MSSGSAAGRPPHPTASLPISHIERDLWMGGCVDGAVLPADFQHVISLTTSHRYRLAPGTHRVEVALMDDDLLPPPRRLYRLAGYALGCSLEGPTLVHCHRGRNRSALVVGLALVLSGMAAEEAIGLQRARRGEDVLSNATFEAWLRKQPAPLGDADPPRPASGDRAGRVVVQDR